MEREPAFTNGGVSYDPYGPYALGHPDDPNVYTAIAPDRNDDMDDGPMAPSSAAPHVPIRARCSEVGSVVPLQATLVPPTTQAQQPNAKRRRYQKWESQPELHMAEELRGMRAQVKSAREELNKEHDNRQVTHTTEPTGTTGPTNSVDPTDPATNPTDPANPTTNPTNPTTITTTTRTWRRSTTS